MHRQRKNIRFKGYNYSANGWYFITICTKDRIPFFGKIKDDKLILSEIGIKAENYWNKIPEHFPNVELGEFVIMPNHIHGLIRIIENNGDVGTRHGVSLPCTNSLNSFGNTIPGSLSSIIGQFKSSLTR